MIVLMAAASPSSSISILMAIMQPTLHSEVAVSWKGNSHEHLIQSIEQETKARRAPQERSRMTLSR